MNGPLVSIIIPVHNTPERLLRECISCVITQAYKMLEIILVDDASEEDIAQICDCYAEKYEFIQTTHIIRTREGGG